MKKKKTMVVVFIAAILIGLLLLLLQFGIVTLNIIREAKNTTYAYLQQTVIIIEKNKDEKDLLLTSLKEDYIILAKAVAHYLDNTTIPDNEYELKKLSSLLLIDEINVFNEYGKIIYSTKPNYIGYTLYSGEQIRYFMPMLTDRTLTMCQDVTPNTAEGKPMLYAMTWNDSGDQMVQVGIEPSRLLSTLGSNEIQATIEDISIDDNMEIIIADASTLEIVGSKNKEYISKNLREITNVNLDNTDDFFATRAKLEGKKNGYFCNISYMDKYCIGIFLSQSSFIDRTIESLLIVSIYLLVAFFVIIIIVKRLLLSREENNQHLQVFKSMSEIYYSLHLLDLENNTAVEYSSRNQVDDSFSNTENRKATEIMKGIMKATMADDYLQRGLEFTDLTTIAERMRGKKIISQELLSKNVGWIRMSFVTIEEIDGMPTKIIVATQIIDEEKKTEELLYRKSHMDELTGCFNRRAYNNDIIDCENCLGEKEIVYISFDVNGLKIVNDDMGHEAGDELICGAVECMKKAFSKHGKIYRTGGDEFVGILYVDESMMKKMCEEFEKEVENWHGNIVENISISYGYVLFDEMKGKTMSEISNLADKRMYESKSRYYEKKGIDRRRT